MNPSCRLCGASLSATFVDLGMSPLCESFLRADQLDAMEPFFPLHVRVCTECLLVQLPEYVAPDEIFSEYAYFSSYSDSWVRHAERYVEAVTQRLGLTASSRVVELASNDGYLLQHFVARGIPCLGVEPARNVAAAAIAKGVPTVTEFFGEALAGKLVDDAGPADLVVANNVLAHVPDINDFIGGIRILVGDSGVLTGEFPHLMRLVEGNQFDTIYHEHFSYYSLHTIERALARHGLVVFDVEELPSHGGSLRVWASPGAEPGPAVDRLRHEEAASGVDRLSYGEPFQERVASTKRALLRHLMDARDQGRRVAGYGAPGKGNTLLNYCGIRTDLLEFTVDRNPYKHGMFLPGTHIPIHPVERIADERPDDILILPWNLEKEIATQLAGVRDWGGRLLVPIPEVRTL